MKNFSRSEIKAVSLTLAVIMLISFFNFRTALRRARDSQRRSDANFLAGALEQYKETAGLFPLSSDDGRIKACEPDDFEQLVERLDSAEINTFTYLDNLEPCEWGSDTFLDLMNPDEVLIQTLPLDPRTGEGFRYIYISNGKFFQLYAYLEGEDSEEGYRESIVARGLACGVNVCNFGRALGETPLDKSIEEYENELSQPED